MNTAADTANDSFTSLSHKQAGLEPASFVHLQAESYIMTKN